MSCVAESETEAAYSRPDEIESLVAAFEAGTLPRESWTHRAHLTVAMWYLARHTRAEATSLIRQGIIKYNHARGILQTKAGGYHETLTLFYIWVVGRFVDGARGCASLVDLANGLIKACGDRNLPLAYYTKERLMSWEARTTWVEPDLKPLD